MARGLDLETESGWGWVRSVTGFMGGKVGFEVFESLWNADLTVSKIDSILSTNQESAKYAKYAGIVVLMGRR